MTAVLQDPAVRAYLDELCRLLGAAPDRDLVVDGVARHIEDAAAGDPARIREVLDELGDPAVIAAESAPPPAAPFLDRRAGGVLTVVLLAVGGLVLPVLGWIAGLVCLWLSHGWRLGDKLVGTLALPVAAGIVLLLGYLGEARLTAPSGGDASDLAPILPGVFPAHLALLLVPALGIVVALVLLTRFRPAQPGA